jgi:hypothetical protein
MGKVKRRRSGIKLAIGDEYVSINPFSPDVWILVKNKGKEAIWINYQVKK